MSETTIENTPMAPPPSTELDGLPPESEDAGPEETHLPGAFCKARVLSVGDELIEVDLGEDEKGRFETSEARRVDGSIMVAVGDEIEVLLDEDTAAGWVVSMDKAEKVRVFERLSELADKHAQVRGVITRIVRGGFSVDIGVKAFLPARESGIRRAESNSAVGRGIQCAIQRFDRKNGEIVLTRRKIAEAEAKRTKSELYDSLKVGTILEGYVTNVTNFGAFVDIGGAEGLLHVTEMGWGRVDKPSDVVAEGDVVRVKVTEVNRERERIGLSMKALESNPWEAVAARFPAGQTFTGHITNLADFGAFVELESGVEGLVHISELSWDRDLRHPSEVVGLDQEVTVKVLEVDIERQRISLSLKALTPNPMHEAMAALNIGDVVTGSVTRIEEYGVFVEIAPGVSGLCHVSDMSWAERIRNPADLRDFAVGQPCEVRILDIDNQRNRIKLGIKQLSVDPWEAAADKLERGAVIEVTISRLTNFGAFATITDGLEGLIHISEINTERVDDIGRELSVNQQVKVKVLEADRSRRKVSLSIKAYKEEGEEGTMRSYADDDDASTSLGALLKSKGLVEADAPEETPEAPAPESAPAEEAAEAPLAEAPAPESDEG